jgi:hypothetical protein
LDDLLGREELDKAGVYILIGSDPITSQPRAYIGEAEVIRERLKQHKAKEFWVSAIVFVSKDESLTKALGILRAAYLARQRKSTDSRSNRMKLADQGFPNRIGRTWRYF